MVLIATKYAAGGGVNKESLTCETLLVALCTNEEFSAAVNVLETRLTLSKSAFPLIVIATEQFIQKLFFLVTCTVFYSLSKQVETDCKINR